MNHARTSVVETLHNAPYYVELFCNLKSHWKSSVYNHVIHVCVVFTLYIKLSLCFPSWLRMNWMTWTDIQGHKDSILIPVSWQNPEVSEWKVTQGHEQWYHLMELIMRFCCFCFVVCVKCLCFAPFMRYYHLFIYSCQPVILNSLSVMSKCCSVLSKRVVPA